ncbi:MAG: hypothetical protein H6822_26830 [Planctomycetaceae bacterium]|nr:hypothetical protein [Planctomycetales bacterium]MCB9925794.1 hypothetical protein [Planctomycetaceae bacterium]
MSTSTTSAEAPSAKYDLNGDGSVSPIDVLLLVNRANEAQENLNASVATVIVLDVNGDG